MGRSIELVNAVGGGDIHSELDLNKLLNDLDVPIKRYDPEYHPSLYVRFEKEGATILIFRTGKYNIAGAESVQDLVTSNKELLTRLTNLGIETSKSESSFEIRNLVFSSEFESEFKLEALTVGLGLEYTEYEPEQFPGVQYTPHGGGGTFLIFRTGKIILTGVNKTDKAKHMFEDLEETLLNMGAI